MKDIKTIKIKRIKYPFASICIVIGVIIAYYSFYYASAIGKNLFFEKSDTETLYNYSSSLSLQTYISSSINELRSLFDDYDMAVIITHIDLYINSSGYFQSCRAYIKNDSTSYPYNIVSGYIPDTDTEYEENLVVLGIEQKKYTTSVDGEDYIIICNEKYRVTGYISAPNSSIYDYCIILFGNAMGDICRTEIENQSNVNNAMYSICLTLKSDSIDLESWLNENMVALNQHLSNYQLSDEDADFDLSSDVTDSDSAKYSYILYFFSLTILIMIIRFYIIVRNDEFVVRRMVGFERKKIAGMIIGNLAMIIFVTTLLLFILQNMFSYISNQAISFSKSLYDFVFLVIFFIVTLGICIINPLYHIFTNDIDECGENLV